MSILLIKVNSRDILTKENGEFFEFNGEQENLKKFIKEMISEEVEYTDIKIYEERDFLYYGKEKTVKVLNIEGFKVKNELKSIKVLNIERDKIKNIYAEIIEEVFPMYKHYTGCRLRKNIIKNLEEKKVEKYNLWFSIIIATLISFFMFWKVNKNYELFNYFGLWVTIVSFLVGGYLLGYRKAKIKNYFGVFLFLSGIILSITYSIFANEMFRVFNTIITPILIVLGAKIMIMDNKKIEIMGFFREAIRTVFITPFYKFTMADGILNLFHWDFEKSKKERNDIIKGIFISIPILIVLGVILAGATNIDFSGAFFEALANIIGKGNYIPMVIVWIISYIYLLGMVKSLTISFENKKTIEEKKVNKTILNTVLVMINSLYLVFTLIQVIGMRGSYSEVARSVFFNLLLVMCINIGIIIKFYREIQGFTRTLFSLMILFSISMGINSILNLKAYIEFYGLTRLRFLSTTFSVFLIIALILILIGLFKEYNVWKFVIITGILIYLGLNYCNMDKIIAKWNINRIQTGEEQKVSSLYYLDYGVSSDAKYAIRDAIIENKFQKLKKYDRQDVDYEIAYDSLKKNNKEKIHYYGKRHWFEYNYYNN